jgi:5-methylcytosine-specific restriction endonuclease McrA
VGIQKATIMKQFGWRCAYYQEGLGVIIEHFVPLSLGGGTTKTNCVPSCYSCNSQKNNLRPDQATKIAWERLEAIRVYLASL